MAIGIATAADHVQVGQTIGYYKGGKFHRIGKVDRIVRGISHTMIYADGKRNPWMHHPSTRVRVIG